MPSDPGNLDRMETGEGNEHLWSPTMYPYLLKDLFWEAVECAESESANLTMACSSCVTLLANLSVLQFPCLVKWG